MAWNIQFFTAGNFSDLTKSAALQGQHIVDAIKVVNPDILMIIEVRTSAGTGIGSLATGSGAAGLRLLHSKLGGVANGWFIVPPQVLNQQARYAALAGHQTRYFEAIGVLFKGANLDFIGPYLNTAAGPVPRDLQNVPPNIQAYAGDWANVLPTTAPRGCGFQGIAQNRFAGQVTLHDGDDDVMWFTGKSDRMPFYTAFWDATGNRVVKLIGVHLPPKTGRAKDATKQLGFMMDPDEDIVTDHMNDDSVGVRVVIGDYNVNANNPAQNTAFNTLTITSHYAMQVPTNGTAGTMLRRSKSHKSPPPLFQGYLKAREGYRLALDNAAVQYYPVAANPGGFEILDWVSTGRRKSKRYPNAFMGTAYTWITTDQQFINPNNYGKIRGASDHLALVVDV